MNLRILVVLICLVFCSCVGQYQTGEIQNENAIDFHTFKVRSNLDCEVHAVVQHSSGAVVSASYVTIADGFVWVHLDGIFIEHHMPYVLYTR